jgi:pyruvate-ferredoxin/flavodoxin oxidoreductase
LSIFGDHQDVMAARTTGFALLASSTVQEAQDLALVAHAATLRSRIPFLHFFDGFRTSHEINKIELLEDDQIRALIDDELILDHHRRALSPDAPVIRGTAQNPDTYFQGRESVNPLYTDLPRIVQNCMDELHTETGRRYNVVDYYGHPEATDVIVVMGSGASTVRETVDWLNANGKCCGVLVIHLYRPFPADRVIEALPDSVTRISVLDRTKEPGTNGEPLYQDIITALAQAVSSGAWSELPRITAGRYGLSSKEFTPAMVKAIFDNLESDDPMGQFTIGIHDDVSHLSLDVDETFIIESDEIYRAMFYGLGSDGTVGANKNTIKIISAEPGVYGQAYFVYDSKKSGAQTVSHLRFGPHPIEAPYLLQSANFIGCHQFDFFEKGDVLERAAHGATLLINSPFSAKQTWTRLPADTQKRILDLDIKVYAINAYEVAQASGMGKRINTIMQTAFFALSDVMDSEKAIIAIKNAIEKTYASKGRGIVEKNFAAVDQALAHLFEVPVSRKRRQKQAKRQVIATIAPEFVHNVTAEMMSARGDRLPVSKIPIDGTWPTGTSQWEKRSIARRIPEWLDDDCIQCGNCSFVCPHSAIRAKFCHQDDLADAPEGLADDGPRISRDALRVAGLSR